MFEMRFYVTREADGTVHVQNAVGGMFGQHHAHTATDFDDWRLGTGRYTLGPVSPDSIEELRDASPCTCGLAAGEMKDGR